MCLGMVLVVGMKCLSIGCIVALVWMGCSVMAMSFFVVDPCLDGSVGKDFLRIVKGADWFFEQNGF